MTTLDTYARFLTARWDEQERAVDEGRRSTDTPEEESAQWGWVRDSLDDLAAKRAVVQIAARYHAAGADGMLEMVELLAAPFRDHPDHPASQEAS